MLPTFKPSPLLAAFRDFVLKRLGLDPSPPSDRRIVLIRRSASRRIANEAAIVAALAVLGHEVEVVDFATLSYEAQIAAVLKARVLIGVHGAGLTNLLWLQDNAAVVEIFTSPAWMPAGYGNLAAWRGVRWATCHREAVTAEPSRPGGASDAISVDVAAITATVAPLLT